MNHYDSEQHEIGISKIQHCPTSLRVKERASERESGAERTSEASGAEQANEGAVRAGERVIPVYLRPEYWLDETTV